MKRPAILLALAAVAYAAAALAVRPGFYDGFVPQAPYRWVSPPPEFRSSNQPPRDGRGSAKVAPNGTVDPGAIFTGDGQAALSFIPGAFATPPDRSPVTIEIKPVASFPDPVGVQLATNVYCISSSSPVAPGKDVLLTLTYSDQRPAPSDIYGYRPGGEWQKLGNTGAAAPFSISMRVSELGCFAGGYPSGAGQTPGPRVGGQTLPLLVAAAILIVVLAGVPLAVLRRRGGDAEDASPGAGGRR